MANTDALPPHEPEPDWLHLKAYGYAPGGYMSKCHRCGDTPIMDKRAVTCRPCAEAMHALAAQQGAQVPHDKLWCETCEGSGQVYQEPQHGCHVGGNYPCPDCDGEGYWMRSASPQAPAAKWLKDVVTRLEQSHTGMSYGDDKRGGQTEYTRGFGDCLNALKKALNEALLAPAAQPASPQAPAQREPVAWLHPHYAAGTYTGPHSPVTFYEMTGWIPLYASPQRAVEPLTDEQIEAAMNPCDDSDFARHLRRQFIESFKRVYFNLHPERAHVITKER